MPYSVSYTQSGMGRYGGSIGTVWQEIGAAVWERYGMVGFGIWERYGSSIEAAVWDRYGMIGFGIRERYGGVLERRYGFWCKALRRNGRR